MSLAYIIIASFETLSYHIIIYINDLKSRNEKKTYFKQLSDLPVRHLISVHFFNYSLGLTEHRKNCLVQAGTSVVEDRPPFGKMLKLPLR